MYRFDKHRTTNHLSLVNDLVWWVAVVFGPIFSNMGMGIFSRVVLL